MVPWQKFYLRNKWNTMQKKKKKNFDFEFQGQDSFFISMKSRVVEFIRDSHRIAFSLHQLQYSSRICTR